MTTNANTIERSASIVVRFYDAEYSVTKDPTAFMCVLADAVMRSATEIYLASKFESVLSEVLLAFPALPTPAEMEVEDTAFNCFVLRGIFAPTEAALMRHADYTRLDVVAQRFVSRVWQKGRALADQFAHEYGHYFGSLVQEEPHAPYYALARGFVDSGLFAANEEIAKELVARHLIRE